MTVVNLCASETSARKKAMKKLTCRKCEGHGIISILKGHAASCPFNECSCNTCTSVMSMRANALIRRFRHRQPNQNSAVLKTIRSKNGNMRLRIVPKNGEKEADSPNETTVHYDERRRSTCSTSSYISSTPDSFTSTPSMSPSLPTSPNSMPALPSPTPTPQEALANKYFTQITQAALIAQLLTTPNLPLFVQTLSNTSMDSLLTVEQIMAQQLLMNAFQPNLQMFNDQANEI
ncbi:hypothetical protein WR25_18093 [Diploscapter pachys]|uniref:DM domain-containing protein n=1 Tax=Diploscapter pachys TaxID=2018661 RepID=A0A2A2LTY0_9BILA|nr:hypothetical protein WR25_18093 [Diploscapter pachys]